MMRENGAIMAFFICIFCIVLFFRVSEKLALRYETYARREIGIGSVTARKIFFCFYALTRRVLNFWYMRGKKCNSPTAASCETGIFLFLFSHGLLLE